MLRQSMKVVSAMFCEGNAAALKYLTGVFIFQGDFTANRKHKMFTINKTKFDTITKEIFSWDTPFQQKEYSQMIKTSFNKLLNVSTVKCQRSGTILWVSFFLREFGHNL